MVIQYQALQVDMTISNRRKFSLARVGHMPSPKPTIFKGNAIGLVKCMAGWRRVDYPTKPEFS